MAQPTRGSNAFRNLLARFAIDRRGATAILLALTIVPILGFVGGAVDYARAYMVKNRLQMALDSAILAAGSTPALTNQQRIEFATKVFQANYPETEIGVPATPLITISPDGVLTGSVTANLDAAILGILGIDKFDLAASAEAKIVSRIEGEIVLVLDYSGSMNSGNKYQTMRDASINLVNMLSQNGQNSKVKFGLVPFSGEVYLTLPRAYVTGQSGSGNWTNCTSDRKFPYNRQNTTPTSNNDTKWGLVCSTNTAGSCSTSYSTCSNYSSRSLVVRPLTNDFSAIKSQLQAMRPHLYTHIALGLEFGWHLISPNLPFNQATAFGDEDILKAIVLLTDGEQTSRGWGTSNSHTVARAEQNLEATCTAIKALDVMLITVAFDLDDATTRARLQNCATSPAHYFDARSNSDLVQAFQAITGTLVKNLHLSR